MSSQSARGRRTGRADETTKDATSESQQEVTAETTTALSDSEVFDVLRNSRRRAVISHLQREDEASVSELTKRVAAEEYDITTDEVSSDQHKRVYTGLYQCHLPRLDDFGVVDFDREEKTVSIGTTASQVEAYLARDENAAAVRLELGVAALVASLATLGVLRVGPFSAVPVTGWALLTVLALLGFALLQLYK